ncbi:ABC transporter ATP-binding protein [Leucobacter sp. NPDC058333]|uniref:ABC transporter ATP-binding protein n=1 Tax=Leucobacter sp. NPDC058333 TaxID=3346450 RepID=UPI00365F8880
MVIRRSGDAFRALIPALRPEYRGMLISYLTGTASALALAALTVMSAWGVGHAVVAREAPGPLWWVVVIALVFARAVLTWQEMDVSHAIAYRVLARLRMALFDSYARSVPGKRHEHSGRAAAVAMDDIEKLEFFYAHTIAQIGTSVTVFLASLITATVLLPGAALVMAAGCALIATTTLYFRRRIRRLGEAEQRLRSELSTQVVDALGSLRETLSYGLAGAVERDVLDTTDRATAIAQRRERLAQLVTGAQEVFVSATVVGVVIASAFAAGVIGAGATGGSSPVTPLSPSLPFSPFSPAMLPAMIALALVGVSAVSEVATTLTQLHPLAASADRVHRALTREPVVADHGDAQPLPDGALGLRFEAVSFSYDDHTSAVSAWSAEVLPGEHVGLAGPSGSGKSTLVALAARLWDPDAGAIELFNAAGARVALQRVDDVALRRAVAVVDQQATLFHGTVRENLFRGADSLPDEDLLAALECVGAISWAPLDGEIGQGGLALSGGQQARLALARALVRQPRVLLVDEVTASLDPETERAISNALATFPGTVLMASHRPESLARMPRVLKI